MNTKRPSETELRRGEALWGSKPQEPLGAPASIVASNLKMIGKNTLICSFDLTVTKWRFVFHGCMLHRKGSREWIAFPAREWIDREGNRKFAALGDFVNNRDARLFRKAALEAVHRLVGGAGR